MVNELSDRQLEDIGIDRWAIRPSVPTIEIKVGLMTDLMSMR